MPETTIVLDISAPWEPPDRPVALRGPGGSSRWLGLLAVLALAGGLLAGGARGGELDPLYSSEYQVLQLQAAAGRFVVTRYQTGGKQVLEALDARDGRSEWQRTLAQDEYVSVSGPVLLLQTERADEHGLDVGRLLALDAATGAVLWQRDRTRQVGSAAGLVLTEEIAWPSEPQGFDTSYGDPEDPAVALPLLPHHERYLALDPGTGRVVWRAEAAPGTVTSLFMPGYPQVTGLSELDADGELRVRDLATGAVAATYRLAWSGAVARHQDGVRGQQVVYRAGGRTAEVFDRATGRRLWEWAGSMPAFNGPYPCLGEHYCIYGEGGTEVLDAANGAPLWRVPRYNGVLNGNEHRLVMYVPRPDGTEPDDLVAVDGRTGAPRWQRRDWHIADLFLYAGNIGGHGEYGAFVWRPTSNTDAVVGRLDPETGAVTAVGRAPDFYGSPHCVATGDRLGCLAVGTLIVWRLR